jgi:hypothetical protein
VAPTAIQAFAQKLQELDEQTTPLSHIPLVHDTFPIHFNKLEMDFDSAKIFRFQKSNHLTIGGIIGWRGSI